MNNNYLLLLLPFLISYGLCISYFDIKYKKIPNAINKFSLFFAILLNFLLYFLFLKNEYSLFFWIYSQLTSILINFIFLFLLWLFELISAADIKSSIVLFFLLPPVFYFNYIPLIYHSIILQTAIIVLFFSIIPKIITNKSFKNTKYFLDYLKPKIIATVFLYMYSLSLFSLIFKTIFKNIPTLSFINIFFIFFIFLILRMIFKNEITKLMIILAFIRILIDFQKIANLKIIYFLDSLIIPFATLYFFIFLMYLSYDSFTKEVKIEELKEGMILAEKIEIKKDKNKIEFNKTQDFKRTIFDQFFNKLNKNSFEKEINYSSKKGLTKENIKKIILLKNEKIFNYDTIRVFEEIPFAIYLILAMFLIYIFNGDPITAITYYILSSI